MSEDKYEVVRKFLNDKCKSAERSLKYYEDEVAKAREELGKYQAALAGLDVAIEMQKLSGVADLKALLMNQLREEIADENKASSNSVGITPAEAKSLLQPELESA